MRFMITGEKGQDLVLERAARSEDGNTTGNRQTKGQRDGQDLGLVPDVSLNMPLLDYRIASLDMLRLDDNVDALLAAETVALGGAPNLAAGTRANLDQGALAARFVIGELHDVSNWGCAVDDEGVCYVWLSKKGVMNEAVLGRRNSETL